MTKQDRQKLSILVVLLAVLGLTLILGYRMNRPATAAVQPPEQTEAPDSPAPSEAYIRLDLLENPEAGGQDIGARNVFEYRRPPATPSPSVMSKGGAPGNENRPVNTAPAAPVRPSGPPPPPPIPLRYEGFAVTGAPSGGFAAFLADGPTADAEHYIVKTGEILMGRYRIVSISDKTVEVEDLEYNRRQTLPRVE